MAPLPPSLPPSEALLSLSLPLISAPTIAPSSPPAALAPPNLTHTRLPALPSLPNYTPLAMTPALPAEVSLTQPEVIASALLLEQPPTNHTLLTSQPVVEGPPALLPIPIKQQLMTHWMIKSFGSSLSCLASPRICRT